MHVSEYAVIRARGRPYFLVWSAIEYCCILRTSEKLCLLSSSSLIIYASDGSNSFEILRVVTMDWILCYDMALTVSGRELNLLLYLALVALPFFVTYLLTLLGSSMVLRSLWHIRSPPLAPYSIPFVGHALSFFSDTGVVGKFQRSVCWRNLQKVYQSNPVSTRDSQSGVIGLKFCKTSINFVTGADNIAKLWRCKDLDATAVTSFSLKQFFLTPEESMKVYLGDDSGISPQPHPRSNVAEKNRYYYQNRKAIVGFFNGPGLMSMGNRFSNLLISEINQLQTSNDWVQEADLYSFVLKVLIGPAVEAMCGPVLRNQNPNFGNDFWKLDHDILYFFKGYPKWLAPSAHQNRAKLLDGVKRWHNIARDNFKASCVELDGHDRFYGSPLMRYRQQYLINIDFLDADAIASQDLGLLWA